mmetsp:Transcript_188/g.420  ORF Transcript_188/g.420 Transcript_188/m.420 type:complete len:244 (-) Transcript_188:172-903(-)
MPPQPVVATADAASVNQSSSSSPPRPKDNEGGGGGGWMGIDGDESPQPLECSGEEGADIIEQGSSGDDDAPDDDGGDDDVGDVLGVGNANTAAAAAAPAAPAPAAAAAAGADGGASLGTARVEHEGVLYSVTSIDFVKEEFTCSNGKTYSFGQRNSSNRHFVENTKGTTRDKLKAKWKAQIKEGGREIYLGQYATEIQAAAAYDKRVRILLQKNQIDAAAETNFPRTMLLPGPPVFSHRLLRG